MKTKSQLFIILTLILVLSAFALFVTRIPIVASPVPVIEGSYQPADAVPTVAAKATMPAGWKTHSNSRFHYSLSYPPGMESTEDNYSWTLAMKLANPDAGARNFFYVSVIPPGFQSSGGDIYNYSTAEMDILLTLRVDESKSLHQGIVDTGFTYTRKRDATLSGQAARWYENTAPYEFPAGTKEIRYYLQTKDYTYLVGGYVDTTGSNQPGAITVALFNQILATFQVMP